MISNKYQGRIVYLVLKDLISKGELFGEQSSDRFDNFKEFSTQRLSTMEGWYILSNNIFYSIIIIALSYRQYNYTTCMREKYNCFDLTNSMIAIAYYCRDMKKCKELFKNRFGIEASIKDCEVIRRVCVAVSTRAARLAAAGIVALVKKIKKTSGCTVAVDGTLYKRALFSDRYTIPYR